MGRPKGSKNLTTLDKQAKEYKEKGEYTACLTLLGKNIQAKGESAYEALSKLSVPIGARAVSVLRVSRGTNSIERILTSFQMKKLSSPSPTMREMAVKNLSILFNV